MASGFAFGHVSSKAFIQSFIQPVCGGVASEVQGAVFAREPLALTGSLSRCWGAQDCRDGYSLYGAGTAFPSQVCCETVRWDVALDSR